MGTTPAPGQFGVVRTNTWVAPFIRILTQSQVNHAFVVLDDAGTILEAQSKGAKIVENGVANYAGYEVYYSAFTLTPEQADPANLMAIAKRLEGTPYNYLDIAALCLLKLGLRWQWLLDRAQAKKADICSQLTDVFMGFNGITLFADKRPNGLVVPGDLLNLLAAGYDVDWRGEVKTA